jgi:DNA-binding transcriptional LysR family regulator
VGITLSEWMDFGFSFIHAGSVNWRVPMVLTVILPLFTIPWLWVLPESPRWLARHGRLEDAREAFARLDNIDPHAPKIDQELALIHRSLEETQETSFWDIFKNGRERVLNRTLLAMTAQSKFGKEPLFWL